MPEAYINLHVTGSGDKGYTATSPDFPGLIAQGDTIAHTIDDARDQARKLAAELRRLGATLPLALRHADPDRIHIKLPVTMV